jgi:acetolactate synthase-1/2/3 large subunit
MWDTYSSNIPHYTNARPDFVSYAAAYGAEVSGWGLVPALEEAFSLGGLHLVTVLVDELKHTQV